MEKTKRLELLEESLAKKKAELCWKIEEHFTTTQQVLRQPLNDKKNREIVMARWKRQGHGLQKLKESIEKIQNAIKTEIDKIVLEEYFDVPPAIQELLDTGVLIQCRKQFNRFFVKGVEKASLIYEDGKLLMSFFKDIPNKKQLNIFRKVCNELQKETNLQGFNNR